MSGDLGFGGGVGASSSRESLLFHSSVTEADAREAAADGVAIFVRQSRYMEAASGARALQIETSLAQARVLGAVPGAAHVVTAWGERAGPGAVRPKFASLRALIRERLIRLVIVPEHHRLSRTVLDAELLFQEAAVAGVLLHIAGRTYNPANPADLFVLEVLAGQAQLENANRTLWGLGSRLTKAEGAQYAIRLPAGLVWVAEDDVGYFARARAAGLGPWLDDLARRHRTDVRVPGPDRELEGAGPGAATARDERTRRYALPFPDADVAISVALRVRWALATGSMDAVAERIAAGADGWPVGHAGEVPAISCRWQYTAEAEVVWQPFERRPFVSWLRSPALFGIYSVYMDALLPPTKRRHQPGRRKGVHFGRAVSQQAAALPTAATLLGLGTPAASGPASTAASRDGARLDAPETGL